MTIIIPAVKRKIDKSQKELVDFDGRGEIIGLGRTSNIWW